jgi:hypothetical protein
MNTHTKQLEVRLHYISVYFAVLFPKVCESLHVIKDISTHVCAEDTYIITKQPPRYN